MQLFAKPTSRLSLVPFVLEALGRPSCHLQVDQQLGPLEVAGGDAHVVLALGVVELGEAPVDQPQLPLLRANDGGRARGGRR